MSFMDCINRALDKERITGKRRDEAKERYENLYNNAVADGMDPIQAEQQAAELATKQVAADIAQRKVSTYKQMAWSIDDWRQWQKTDGNRIVWNANAVIEGTIASTPGRVSLNDNTTHATGQIRGFIQDMMNKYSPKLIGLVYPKAGLENIVREVFKPGSTGDATAAAMAKAWTKATDYGVMLYQRTGGLLNHLEEWRMPQYQSRIKAFKAKETQWVKDHSGWVDWNKMTFPDGSRIEPADQTRVLKEAYKSIITDGDIRINPGQTHGHGGGSLTEHRFLIYKDADSWLAAHEKYADGSIYDTMSAHVDSMGRRIGIAQSFGPKPEMGLEQMISNMKRVAGEADAAVTAGTRPAPKQLLGLFPTTYTDDAKRAENFLRDAFQVKVKGMNAPLSGASAGFAGLMGTSRSLIMSAVGGSVYLYQGTQDFFTAALRYRLAGLPVMHAMSTYFKTFSGMNKDMVDLFSRSGFINLAQSNVAQSAGRLTGLEPGGMQWARHVSDVVMRASLTEWHAASARLTTAMEFSGALADWKDMSFDQVPGKAIFESHGITPEDWDAMRATPVNRSLKGHAFLMPDDHIVHAGQTDDSFEVANKFMAMINQEAKLATIETQVAAQLTLKGATRPGTLIGEVTRSLAMFKNFPLTLFNTHIRQAILADTIPGKIGYGAQVLLGMTLFGAVGVMLHDIAAGKNPEEAFNKKSLIDPLFWTRGLLASGGGGIVSDLIAGNLEHGKTFGESLAGAPISMLSDLTNLAGTAAETVAGNQKAHFAREANKFGSRWLPGNTIWYLRAPLRAMVWDNLLKATDPDAAAVFQRRAAWTQKQTGQSYWWGPGESAPNSAPDLTSLVRK
jgi:hypothetical protein